VLELVFEEDGHGDDGTVAVLRERVQAIDPHGAVEVRDDGAYVVQLSRALDPGALADLGHRGVLGLYEVDEDWTPGKLHALLAACELADVDCHRDQGVAADRVLARQAPLELGGPEMHVVLLGGPELTNDHIAGSVSGTDDYTGEPRVIVTLTAEGKQLFLDLSTRTVGRRIAIALDGEVVSAPVVREPIPGGVIQISLGSAGSFEESSARTEVLAAQLGATALSVPLSLLETRVIDAP
jgi:preprotein translocase subunit SecD